MSLSLFKFEVRWQQLIWWLWSLIIGNICMSCSDVKVLKTAGAAIHFGWVSQTRVRWTASQTTSFTLNKRTKACWVHSSWICLFLVISRTALNKLLVKSTVSQHKIYSKRRSATRPKQNIFFICKSPISLPHLLKQLNIIFICLSTCGRAWTGQEF